MNQDPNFPRFGQQGAQQYGLHSFDAPPAKRGFVERVFGPRVARKFSSPLFATSALLLCGVTFAGVIVSVYPDKEAEVPVVKADTFAYMEAPAEPGGMIVANRDSAVFAAMDGGIASEPAPIENLLAEEEAVDKLAAFARQVEESMEEAGDAAASGAADAIQDVSTLASAGETAPVTLKKIEDTSVAIAEAAPKVAVRPQIIHKPGENPDTLAFVKSVLDKKDSRAVSAVSSSGSASDVAMGAASIQPAAGNAGRRFSITAGQHYVQLGSVKSLAGAEGEWGKIQKAFSAELGTAQHRVQAAELGERGTFYRIQAGPMSKTSAASICDSIKMQKPGGCLVTQ